MGKPEMNQQDVRVPGKGCIGCGSFKSVSSQEFPFICEEGWGSCEGPTPRMEARS